MTSLPDKHPFWRFLLFTPAIDSTLLLCESFHLSAFIDFSPSPLSVRCPFKTCEIRDDFSERGLRPVLFYSPWVVEDLAYSSLSKLSEVVPSRPLCWPPLSFSHLFPHPVDGYRTRPSVPCQKPRLPRFPRRVRVRPTPETAEGNPSRSVK